jgi:hypothetical protein
MIISILIELLFIGKKNIKNILRSLLKKIYFFILIDIRNNITLLYLLSIISLKLFSSNIISIINEISEI